MTLLERNFGKCILSVDLFSNMWFDIGEARDSMIAILSCDQFYPNPCCRPKM